MICFERGRRSDLVECQIAWEIELRQPAKNDGTRRLQHLFFAGVCLPDNCTPWVFGRMLTYRVSALELT